MICPKIYTPEGKKLFKVEISSDWNAEDPSANLPKEVHYAFFYPDYGLEQNFEISEEDPWRDYFRFRRFRKLVLRSGEYVFLPVYIHQHSDIVLSFEPFHDPYESWLLGYIWYHKERAMRETGYKDGEKFLAYVKEQADLYMKYLMGEIFRYDVIDDDGRSIDSKGEIYDYEEAERMGNEALERVLKEAPEQMELFPLT